MTTTERTDRRQHEERAVWVPAAPEAVFAFADDHLQFAEHMASSSWMMFGSAMSTRVDAARGQEIGSHITMEGSVLGVGLSLDEVVTERVVPTAKAWETIGEPRLLVIGPYRMGFQITRNAEGSTFRVFIDYELPRRRRWLGLLFGAVYARWCVNQMARSVERRFSAVTGQAA